MTNNNLDKLQQLLEQATAQPQLQDGLTGEAAKLNEAWTAFVHLVEAAEPAGEPEILRWSMPQSTVTAASRPHRLTLSATAMLAASLLIGIVVAWSYLAGQSDKSSQQPVAIDRQVKPLEKHTATQVAKSQEVNNPKEVASVASRNATTTPKWDDSWDEQVSNMGKDVLYAQHELYAGPDAAGSLQYGIEQMQQEMTGNNL
ncbi:MAG: hypothetical protein ABFC63_08475 [Thermoguttaceae bacterium]